MLGMVKSHRRRATSMTISVSGRDMGPRKRHLLHICLQITGLLENSSSCHPQMILVARSLHRRTPEIARRL